MKIAILGTRGIPNRYGGFEAFAEKLSHYLAEEGHQVTVYCRKPFTRPGDDKLVDPRVCRVVLPSIKSKHLDTPLHTFLSVLHVLFTDADIVLICNSANGPLAWIPRLFGKPVVLNVDGLDRQRKKWGWFAQAVLSFCEFLSVFAPTRVVTDALTVQEYYRRRYSKTTTMIAYGADVPEPQPNSDGLLAQFHLQPKKYLLYVSRLEPENNPELVIRAYQQIRTDWPLVMVGGNAYDPDYEQRLRALADELILFTGAIYGEGYWELQRHAGIFIFGCEVGGIHPALIETMAAGNASLYLDTESNRETAGDCGLVFSRNEDDLAARMSRLIADPGLRRDLGKRAAEYARQRYSWTEVTNKYERLFHEILR